MKDERIEATDTNMVATRRALVIFNFFFATQMGCASTPNEYAVSENAQASNCLGERAPYGPMTEDKKYLLGPLQALVDVAGDVPDLFVPNAPIATRLNNRGIFATIEAGYLPFSALHFKPGSNALARSGAEFGCGTGHLVLDRLAAGADWYGVSFNESIGAFASYSKVDLDDIRQIYQDTSRFFLYDFSKQFVDQASDDSSTYFKPSSLDDIDHFDSVISTLLNESEKNAEVAERNSNTVLSMLKRMKALLKPRRGRIRIAPIRSASQQGALINLAHAAQLRVVDSESGTIIKNLEQLKEVPYYNDDPANQEFARAIMIQIVGESGYAQSNLDPSGFTVTYLGYVNQILALAQREKAEWTYVTLTHE